MIIASLEKAAADDRTIRIHPRPVTRKDAVINLKAFAADRSTDEVPSHFEPILLDTQINPCLGWATIKGKDANKLLWARRQYPSLREESHFAIVYRYVPREKLDEAAVQIQLDFFYRVGFVWMYVEERNWRGAGSLVDFSDVVSPHAPEWDSTRYGRMVKTRHGFYHVERIISVSEKT